VASVVFGSIPGIGPLRAAAANGGHSVHNDVRLKAVVGRLR
jgi:hypothetical protein